MTEPVRVVVASIFAAVAGAIVPPLAMALAWALMSQDPVGFFKELGGSGLAAFVASQQHFFAPVAATGLGAHAVLFGLRRLHPLLYAGAFYLVGAVVYAVSAVPQLASFTLTAPVLRTLLVDAFLWWAPLAAASGLVFWTIAARPWRRRW